MTIQEVKTIYTAGLEAIVETGADEVCKHNRKGDVSLFMERGKYCVDFCGPVTHVAHGSVSRGMVSVSVYCWHTMDYAEQGTEHFDNPKDAIRFLRKAIRHPERVMKKMETYYVD